MKVYIITYNVGSTPYVVSFHDGVKTHADGSAFFDIALYRNLRKMRSYIARLRKLGYIEAP